MREELQMNEMQVFENTMFGQIRTLEKIGQPWFAAADVHRASAHNNAAQAGGRKEYI